MIERTLNGTAGVEMAVVTLATNRGHVEFDPAILGARDIIRIVKVSGVASHHEVAFVLIEPLVKGL